MDNREEFERWAMSYRDNDNLPHFVMKDSNGDYVSSGTTEALKAWQAARSDSWILRQQADAIDECLSQWRETEEGKKYFTMSPGFLRDFAERLRREADEAGGDL